MEKTRLEKYSDIREVNRRAAGIVSLKLLLPGCFDSGKRKAVSTGISGQRGRGEW